MSDRQMSGVLRKFGFGGGSSSESSRVSIAREIHLEPFSGPSAGLRNATSVYSAVWRRNYNTSLAFFERYCAYPHYQGLLAVYERQTVGMGFGHLTGPGQWWHDRVAEQVGADNPGLKNAWVMVELAVMPDYQGRGVGNLLIDALMKSQPLERSLLSVAVTNVDARRFYLRHGWSYLHEGFVFGPGQPPYAVMRRELREPPTTS